VDEIDREEERAETEGIEKETAWSALVVPVGSTKFNKGVKED
jgi:hypothetical protein